MQKLDNCLHRLLSLIRDHALMIASSAPPRNWP
jgi:hypothetical protein